MLAKFVSERNVTAPVCNITRFQICQQLMDILPRNNYLYTSLTSAIQLSKEVVCVNRLCFEREKS